MSFADNDNRVPEAAALASELEEMVDGIDCDAATKSTGIFSFRWRWHGSPIATSMLRYG